jgi:hypothetical protein
VLARKLLNKVAEREGFEPLRGAWARPTQPQDFQAARLSEADTESLNDGGRKLAALLREEIELEKLKEQ